MQVTDRWRAPSPPIDVPRPRSDSYDEEDERQYKEDSWRLYVMYERVSKGGVPIPDPAEEMYKARQDRQRSRSPPLAASPAVFVEPSSLVFIME